jgi:hypothetical protein
LKVEIKIEDRDLGHEIQVYESESRIKLNFRIWIANDN